MYFKYKGDKYVTYNVNYTCTDYNSTDKKLFDSGGV